MSAQTFHVNCPFTGQAVCCCTLGTPASAAQQASDYSRNAALQYQMWQHQSQMFAQPSQPPVDIALPRLLRQTVPELGPMPAPGPMDKETAIKVVRQARLQAEAAVSTAARYAAAAGLSYQAPPGFQLGTELPRKDFRELEASVRAIERARAERRARSEQGASTSQRAEEERQAAYARDAERVHQQQRQRQHQQQMEQEEHAQRQQQQDHSLRQRQQQQAQQQAAQQQQHDYAGGWAMGGTARQKQKPQKQSQFTGLPSPKAKSKAAKATEASGAQEEAWAAAPDRGLRLRMKDIRASLRERWLQLFWPDDGRWWPGQVLDVRPKERRISLLYKTGEEEADLDLGDLVRKGEVAWLSAMEMEAAAEAALEAPPLGDTDGHNGGGLFGDGRSMASAASHVQPVGALHRGAQPAYVNGGDLLDDPFDRIMSGRQLPLVDF